MIESISLGILILGWAFMVLTLPGTIELFLLTLGSFLPLPRQTETAKSRDLSLAIIVPAHNEEKSIAHCVANLKQAQHGACTIVVIADNCTDNTAKLAMAAGARVLVRNNESQKGKGYALDYAFQSLLKEDYDAFVIVDADAHVSSNFIDEIQKQFALGADAVQVAYGVNNPEAGMRTRLMRVALMAFNGLRPRGRMGLGLSAGILGNGFALTAETLKDVPYDAQSIVEDIEYHIRLVESGRRVEFISNANVLSDMPANGAGVTTQRARWEGGRLRLLFDIGPRLLKGVLQGRLRLLEPLLDLMLLPLAFQVVLLLPLIVIPYEPIAYYATGSLCLIALHTLWAIVWGGGNKQDLAALAFAPFYVIWKVGILPFLIKASQKNAAWVRTERTQAGGLKR